MSFQKLLVISIVLFSFNILAQEQVEPKASSKKIVRDIAKKFMVPKLCEHEAMDLVLPTCMFAKNSYQILDRLLR